MRSGYFCYFQPQYLNMGSSRVGKTFSGNFSPDCQLLLRRQLANRVFLVDDKESTRFVAKIIDLESSQDIDNIVDAIRFGKLLRHPNILPIFYSFVDQTNLWIICPFFNLGSADVLSAPTGLDEIMISVVMKDTLSALDYLHSKGIIHRTIQGSHILVKSSGGCVLTGLSYAMNIVTNGVRQSKLHDYPRNSMSSMNWLAPEVLEQNLEGYDFKSDVYSVGATCCELANGYQPFFNMAPTEMLLQKLTGINPRILDATCTDLFNLEGTSPEDKERFDAYQCRRFSDSFQAFTNLCLMSDPNRRPNVSQLLTHSFLRQSHKNTGRGVFSFLHHRILDHRDDVVDLYQSNESCTHSESNVSDQEWTFD